MQQPRIGDKVKWFRTVHHDFRERATAVGTVVESNRFHGIIETRQKERILVSWDECESHG